MTRILALLAIFALLFTSPATAKSRIPPLAENAGFSHAMKFPRTPVTVQHVDDPSVAEGIAYWNIAAQWRLLTFVDSGAEIAIDQTTCCWALWSGPAPYTSCTAVVGNGSFNWSIVAHEIGHCLGWAGHPPRGIISGQDTNLRYDRKLLQGAGYFHERICDPTCEDG